MAGSRMGAWTYEGDFDVVASHFECFVVERLCDVAEEMD